MKKNTNRTNESDNDSDADLSNATLNAEKGENKSSSSADDEAKAKRGAVAYLNPNGRFKKGNPGRPRGSKDKLEKKLINRLLKDFEENGVAAIEALRERDPGKYLTLIAKVVTPKTSGVGRGNGNIGKGRTGDGSSAEVAERLRTFADFIEKLEGPRGKPGDNARLVEARPIRASGDGVEPS